MAKATTVFVCRACGASFPRWLGRCTSCGEWDALEEQVKRAGATATTARAAPGAAVRAGATRVADVQADDNERIQTGIGELDRVLGGGVVLGGVVLVGRDPGVGQSTLLLQALAGLASRGCRSMYVSGEESAGQTASRAKRLGAQADELVITGRFFASNPIRVFPLIIPPCTGTGSTISALDTRIGSASGFPPLVSQCAISLLRAYVRS